VRLTGVWVSVEESEESRQVSDDQYPGIVCVCQHECDERDARNTYFLLAASSGQRQMRCFMNGGGAAYRSLVAEVRPKLGQQHSRCVAEGGNVLWRIHGVVIACGDWVS
jgi:hypothetical protein